MIAVSNSTISAFASDCSVKSLTISFPDLSLTYTNTDIEAESLSLVEDLNADENLTFEGCNSTTFKARIAGVAQDLRGAFCTVNIMANSTDLIPLFQGYVRKQTFVSQADMLTEIVAYDALYDLNNVDIKAWYDTLTFPMTLKNFRDAFLTEVGLTQETTTLVNDSLMLSKSIQTATINARSVLGWICQANGRFGVIGRNGIFKYVKLSPIVTPNIPLTKSDYKTMSHERYTVQAIDNVKIFNSEGTYSQYGNTELNPLCISDNPIAYGLPMTQAAENIYAEVVGITYTPLEIELRGLPYVEIGDSISVTTTQTTINSFIIHRTLSGVQALFDNYTSAGDELQPQYKEDADGTRLAIERYNRIEGDATNSAAIVVEQGRITAEVKRATDEETRISTLVTQTADGLQVQINEIYSELDGQSQLYYTTYQPTLLNYPAWDFTYNIPCDNTVQLRDDLAFEYKDEYYRKNLRAIVFDETHSLTYRFIKSGGVYYWDEVSNTDTSLILSRVSTLEATTTGIQTQVTQVEANLTNNYYTIVQTDTKFTQTNNAITAEVTRATTAEADKIDKTSSIQSVADILTDAQQRADAAAASAKDASIARTTTYQDAGSIVSAAVAQAATAGDAAYIAQTVTYQTADNIVFEATKYTDDHAYAIQSGVEITASGIEISGGSYVKIKSGSSFSVDSGNFSIDTSGNVTVKGAITATSLTLGAGVTVAAGNVSGLSAVATSGTYASLSGTPDLTVYVAKDGTIGSTPSASTTGFKVSSAGLLTASNAVIYGTVYASAGSFTGTVTSNNASIKGYVNATSGYIGNFIINNDGFTYNDLGHIYDILRNTSEAVWALGNTDSTLNVKGSTTNITASGTVNIGTSAAQTVKVKGRTVSWEEITYLDDSYTPHTITVLTGA